MPEPSAALITGATEGIGRATAFALGRAGYRVGICARTGAKVRQVVEALRAEGIDAAGTARFEELTCTRCTCRLGR